MPRATAKVCYNCGEKITKQQTTGTFLGTEMHQLCAIELRLDALEDAMSDDGDDLPRLDSVLRTAYGVH